MATATDADAAAHGGGAQQQQHAATPIPRKRLGGSSLEVPIICLGTMTMGEQNDEAQSFEILDEAFARGVDFFDTAELYPVPPRAETMNSTELILGRWMAARGNRDKVTIATKVAGVMPGLDRAHVVAGRFDPPKPAVPGGPQPQLNAEQIRQACEASLRRLQTDRIDLFYIHWPARYCPVFGRRRYCPDQERDASSFDEQVAVMGELIKEGKIREWGLSNETTFGVCRMAEAAARLGVKPPAAIQNDVSLTLRAFEGELAEACAPRNFNIGLCAYGCLTGGTLAGKYRGGAKPAGARHTLFPGFQPRYHHARVANAADRYAALAERRGLTPTQLALGWAASRWYMGSVIIGATSVAQLRECVDACLTKVDAETEAELDALYLEIGDANLQD